MTCSTIAPPLIMEGILTGLQVLICSLVFCQKLQDTEKIFLIDRNAWLMPNGMLKSVSNIKNTTLTIRLGWLSIEWQSLPTTLSVKKATILFLLSSLKGLCALSLKNYCWIVSSYFSWNMYSSNQSGSTTMRLFHNASTSSNLSYISHNLKLLGGWLKIFKFTCCFAPITLKNHSMIYLKKQFITPSSKLSVTNSRKDIKNGMKPLELKSKSTLNFLI